MKELRRLRQAGMPGVRFRSTGSTHEGARASAHGPIELPLSLEAYEKSALERALRESAGDAGEAARRLGIGRSTFYRKLAKHGIGDGRGAGGPETGLGAWRGWFALLDWVGCAAPPSQIIEPC